MTTLQHTARPWITGMPVWSGELALRMVEVLIQDFSIGFDRDQAVFAITDCDAALLTRADVVVDRVKPLFRMFGKAGDEDGFVSSFLRVEFVTKGFVKPY
jgi:hypothetical protein